MELFGSAPLDLKFLNMLTTLHQNAQVGTIWRECGSIIGFHCSESNSAKCPAKHVQTYNNCTTTNYSNGSGHSCKAEGTLIDLHAF